MAKVFITNVEKVSFQIGVDILGFPIYHEHIFMDAVKTEDKTKMKGKNQSKHVVKYHEVMYFTHNQLKQN
ncbi:glutamyl-tRNA amidotransferase [Capnocytophaga canis]|uniref:glutamyl-tRNA amidotransferase n=1 Tax=Capnocytophaga canis TaxID=1848903 RepID=UPI0037D2E984